MKKKNFKDSFNNRAISSGVLSFIVMVAVVVAVIFVNLVVKRLELKSDLTNDQLYSITDDTIDMLKKVDDNITIYYLTTSSEKDDAIYELVSKYHKYGKNINIELKDVEVYPKFVEQYSDTVTSENFVSNSVVVVNNDKKDAYKFIPYGDMVVNQYDYQTYQVSSQSIDVEGQITSAINAVTSDKANKMYFVTGHGEKEKFGDIIGGLIKKKNFEFDKLNLATTKVPEDCSLLALVSPAADISKEELKMIEEYLDAGNQMLLIFGYNQNTDKMENLNALLAYYSLQTSKGLLIEKSTSNFMSSVSNILPEVDSSSEIASDVGSIRALFPTAVGLKEASEVSDYVTINKILTTSDMSYAITDTSLEVNKVTASNSEPGPFILGASVEKKYNDITSKLVVFTSDVAFDEETFGNYITNLANPTLLLNSVNWLCDLSKQGTIAIPAKSDSTTQIVLESSQINKCFLMLVLVVPALILIVGLSIWVVRRKR